MNAQEILTELQHACKKLYANQKYLIEEKSNELTIASHIASYLRESIQGWDIDTDYRREGIDRNPKRDLEGTLIIPDIIIHKHGPDGPNLVAIEIKGYWNPENRAIDTDKLRAIRLKHQYEFLFRIELLNDGVKIIEVDGIM